MLFGTHFETFKNRIEQKHDVWARGHTIGDGKMADRAITDMRNDIEMLSKYCEHHETFVGHLLLELRREERDKTLHTYGLSASVDDFDGPLVTIDIHLRDLKTHAHVAAEASGAHAPPQKATYMWQSYEQEIKPRIAEIKAASKQLDVHLAGFINKHRNNPGKSIRRAVNELGKIELELHKLEH